jgi:predicted component of type VI protein secretion system
VLRDGDRFQVGKFLIGVRVVAETDQTVAIAQPQRRVARGGDPAAVADSQWRASGYDPRAPGLGMSSGFTRIAKPWVDTSTDDSPAYATVPNVRPPEGDDEVLAGDAGDFVASAAEGLGLSVKELVKAIGSADPSTIAQRVARLLRVATFALHHQLLLESRQLRAITGQAALGHADPLVQRLLEAASPQLAVGELLAARGDAEVALVHAHGELGQHSQRLIAAFGAACQRLGELLDPERQAQAAGSAGSAELWQGYVSLWKGLGMSAGQPWSDCLVDAAGAYLCEAYAQAQAEPGGGGEGEAGA